MNGLSPARIGAYLAAVFIAGAAAGIAGGYQWGRKAAFTRPERPRDMATHMIERYSRDLALTPEQVSKVEPIVRDALDRVRTLHRENFKQTDAIMKGCNEQIVALLDETQKNLFQEMEERRKRWMRDRGGDRERPKGPPPTGGHPDKPPGEMKGFPPPPGALESSPNRPPGASTGPGCRPGGEFALLPPTVLFPEPPAR